MRELTGKAVSIIGMVHVRALPGTPRSSLKMEEIRRIASEEARQLFEAGFDAILVENMHDVPYLNRKAGPEIVAAMTSVVGTVRESVSCPVGVQILAGANREALAVAHTAGARFIRAEGFVFGHMADEGYMDSDAGKLLRFRKTIGAEDIKIFADIKKKHAGHAITADVSLEETARAAEFFGADALVITGRATGEPTNPDDLAKAAKATRIPLIVGSGTTPENIAALWPPARGFIIGSFLKKEGRWDNPLDAGRMKRIMEAVHTLRETNAEN